ncbi:MAG: AAA domain-containing protein [Kiritimatiellaeota bacterium]|nr:AAA domain-containing protein [Kiritimatiellota bacterium]
MSEKIPQDAAERIAMLPELAEKIKAELAKRIIGQRDLINQLVVAIFARGHCLLIGVPGLAKTLLIHTLGEIADLKFARIQFTPDMMPMDITGSEILEEDHATGHREFKFIRGPIFAQLILADEINRTPPKTQAALLEAMQEQRVTVAGKKYDLASPFFVLATQNPIEQEGTYPLPEAQLDRFMFSLNVVYPKFEEEVEVLLTTTRDNEERLEKVVGADEIIALQTAIRHIPVPRSVAEYTVKLVSATRPNAEGTPDFINKYLRWGAGPRACQYLALAGKVHAAMKGRFNVALDDIKNAAYSVLRHRIILNYQAEADMRTPENVIEELLGGV